MDEETVQRKRLPKELVGYKPGQDYTGAICTVQMVSLLYIFLMFSEIDSKNSTANALQQLQNNQFSFEMVAGLAIQIIFIIMERVAYLIRSLQMRLMLQYSAVIILHVAVVFVLPNRND